MLVDLVFRDEQDREVARGKSGFVPAVGSQVHLELSRATRTYTVVSLRAVFVAVSRSMPGDTTVTPRVVEVYLDEDLLVPDPAAGPPDRPQPPRRPIR